MTSMRTRFSGGSRNSLAGLRAMVGGNGLVLPLLGFASLIAFMYMSFGDTAFHFMEPRVEMSLVGRNGTQFVVDGKAFYVSGWNSYWLMDHAVEDDSRPRIRAMFRLGAEMGFSVCRTWAFNDGGYNALQLSPGKFDERVFKALDRVIYEARRHGIRVLLSLINNLQAYGGKTQYVQWAWQEWIGFSSSNDSFFFDPSIRSYFKSYVKTVLTRRNHLTGVEYRDDPTIFAWELMNEPRCITDPSGDTLQKYGFVKVYNLKLRGVVPILLFAKDWIEEMSSYVKSIDNKHLVTVGLEGFYGPSSPPEKLKLNPHEWYSKTGVDFIRNFKPATIDFASVHIYPDQWMMLGASIDEKIKFSSRWVTCHIEDGEKELRKPVLFAEFGISNRSKNFDHSHRDVFYKNIFDIIHRSARKNRAGAGAFIWQLMVGGMEKYKDDYVIVPEERPSIYQLLKRHSCRLLTIRYRQDRVKLGSKAIC